MTDIPDRRRMDKVAKDLPRRIDALARVVELADGRIDPALYDEASFVVSRSRARLDLSADHTVVALAGSTGSGKSSLFNAIAGLDLAKVGVRRPTTSTALACVWGGDGAAGILEWLGIDPRYQVMRSSVLENADDTELRGLVLLDLPDHDSTEVAHRLEVSRLTAIVDVLIWVVDPQKYADAAIHEAFLRPLAGHVGAVVVVLNQVDRLTRQEADACVADLSALLVAEGLGGAPLLTTSVSTMKGIKRLRALLGERVLKRQSFATRLSADLDKVAGDLTAECGSGAAPRVDSAEEHRLMESYAAAAGLEGVVGATERSWRSRGQALVRWAPLRLMSRRPRDPLPSTIPVQRAQVDAATRRFGDSVARDVKKGWGRAVRAACWSQAEQLPEALDQAVAAIDLQEARPARWWRAAAGVQWVLLAIAVVGVGWLVATGMTGDAAPSIGGAPLPVVLIAVGVVLGIALGAFCHRLVATSARSTASSAGDRISAAVEAVARVRVVRPVEAELARLGEIRTLLAEVERAR